MRSHSHPNTSRATMVAATEARTVLATWSLVRPRSARTVPISGASPNQPKKHRKKATHEQWNTRMRGDEKLKRSIRPGCGIAGLLAVDITIRAEPICVLPQHFPGRVRSALLINEPKG